MKTASTTITRTGVLILLAILSGCASPEFASSWRIANGQFTPGVPQISGPWEGTWTSTNTGHTGEVRCLITPIEGEPHQYRAHYWASWAKLVTGEYVVDYELTPKGNGYRISTTQDLGVSGVYQQDGRITADTFDCTFSSEEGDIGVFKLARPGAGTSR